MSREIADPNCTKCKGRGFIYPRSWVVRPGEQGGRYCDCAMETLLLEHMDRIWPSLSQAREIPNLRSDPPLKPFVTRDLWITAPERIFRAHLKALAFNMSSSWDTRVIADSQLLDSWLGTARAQGAKILDIEVDQARLEELTLPDLVEPYKLLIILMGVKRLANRESPNSLLEALNLRRYRGLPTWIVDQPDQPINYVSHKFYSDTLAMLISHWQHVEIQGAKLTKGREEDSSSKEEISAQLPTASDLEKLLDEISETTPVASQAPRVSRPPSLPSHDSSETPSGNRDLDRLLGEGASKKFSKKSHFSRRR